MKIQIQQNLKKYMKIIFFLQKSIQIDTYEQIDTHQFLSPKHVPDRNSSHS